MKRDALYESLVAGAVSVAAGFESDLAKLRADVFGRDSFIASSAAATLHCIARKKTELGADVSFLDLRSDRASDDQ